MAEAVKVFTNRNGTFRFTDGTNTYDIPAEDGDLSLDIPRETLVDILSRGKFLSPPQIRKVTDQAMAWSITAFFSDPRNTTDATLMDFLLDAGFVASDWTPTNGANAEVPTWTCQYILDATNDCKAATIELPFSTVRGATQEGGEGSKITVSGQSRALVPTITIT